MPLIKSIILYYLEIGGPQESEVPAYLKTYEQPMMAYIDGLTAPLEQIIGHASAIVNSSGETVLDKIVILKDAGIILTPNPANMESTVAMQLKGC